MADSERFIDDEDFQNHLIALLCRDPQVLKKTAPLLSADDFKPSPGTRDGRARWIVADRALGHYQKYHEPIGRLLKADVLQYCEELGLGERGTKELTEYVSKVRKLTLTAPDATTDKILKYKRQKLKASVIEEMIESQASGELSDERWLELSQKAVNHFNGNSNASDYFQGFAARLERQQLQNLNPSKVPYLFIDPLDRMVRGIGPGNLGLILAPTGRGKSLTLIWLAIAYTLQRLNVLYVTLEDPQEDVEKRLDSAITGIPIKRLPSKPKLFKKRFERFRRHIRSQLKLVDGTDEDLTIPKIEQILLRERELGFRADALIIDYDDFIKATTKHKEKRFEYSDIYKEFKQVLSRHKLIGWTAAQTQRDTEHRKILSGSTVAEDISKVRKAAMVIGVGAGEWGEESVYFWVAKHRYDRQHVGCNVISDRSRMLIYDRDKTRQKEIEQAEIAQAAQDDDN